jgi:hypothetical protein
MNKFLQSLEITFRRDPTNFRPRVNKLYSVKDKEQKGPFSVDVLRAPSDDPFVQHREITSSSRSDFLWPLRRRLMYDGDGLPVNAPQPGTRSSLTCGTWLSGSGVGVAVE